MNHPQPCVYLAALHIGPPHDESRGGLHGGPHDELLATTVPVDESERLEHPSRIANDRFLSPSPCDEGVDGSVIGLTQHGQVYVNGTLVLSNCTSFAVHKAFLLFTTHRWIFNGVVVCLSLCG